MKISGGLTTELFHPNGNCNHQTNNVNRRRDVPLHHRRVAVKANDEIVKEDSGSRKKIE
jgi:hypothetical protein